MKIYRIIITSFILTTAIQPNILAQEKIVFSKSREIHSMNTNGSNIKQLTDYKVPGHTPISVRPSLTKSGNIGYIYDPVRHGWMSTYIMNMNGLNKTRISKEPKSKASSTWNSVVSPNGKYYVFVSNRSDNDEIYRMDVDGSNIVNISNTSENEGSPKWSPDGKYIIYTATNPNGGSDIITTNINGNNKNIILHSDLGLGNVTFSKDGKLIAYAIMNSKASQLVIANSDGSNAKTIMSINKWSRLSFSPDSSRITFVSKNGKIATIKLDGSEFKEFVKGVDPVWSF